MTTLSSQIKLLANGINPETGELLPDTSVVHRADVIRTLFALSEELADIDRPRPKKPRLTLEERREKNIAEGRPPEVALSMGRRREAPLGCGAQRRKSVTTTIETVRAIESCSRGSTSEAGPHQ